MHLRLVHRGQRIRCLGRKGERREVCCLVVAQGRAYRPWMRETMQVAIMESTVATLDVRIAEDCNRPEGGKKKKMNHLEGDTEDVRH